MHRFLYKFEEDEFPICDSCGIQQSRILTKGAMNTPVKADGSRNILSIACHLRSLPKFCLSLPMMEPSSENTEDGAYSHNLPAMVGDLASISRRGLGSQENGLVSSARNLPSLTFVVVPGIPRVGFSCHNGFPTFKTVTKFCTSNCHIW